MLYESAYDSRRSVTKRCSHSVTSSATSRSASWPARRAWTTRVRWVHISEIVDPTPWLSGGELLLTTGLQLERPERSASTSRGSPRHGLSGLGLRHRLRPRPRSPRRCAKPPTSSASRCSRCPYEVPFIAVTEKAFTHLVNEHYAVLQRALSAHERLERIVLSERGLDGVAARARVADRRPGDRLRRAAARCSPAAPPGRRCRSARWPRCRRAARARPRGRPPRLRARRRAGRPRARAAGRRARRRRRRPATARRRRRGSSRPRTAAPLTEFDRLDAPPGGHGRRARAAAPARRRRHRAPPRRRRALRDGVRRARRRRAGAAAASRSGCATASACSCSRRRARCAARVEDALAARAARRGARRARRRHRRASLRAGAARARRRRRRAVRARRARARARVGEPASALAAGAGRPVAAGDLRRAFHEARCALEARGARRRRQRRRRPGSPPTATSAPSSCCSRCRTTRRCGCSATRSSRPIEEGEGAYGGELMRSLEAFIECNGQWERAARQLYCHRHTLRYRIRRVEELTGARWTPRATGSTSGWRCAGAS